MARGGTTRHEIFHDRHVSVQLAHKQHTPLTNQSNLSVFKNGLDYSSKPDFPRPNNSKNQRHQPALAAAEDKTRLEIL